MSSKPSREAEDERQASCFDPKRTFHVSRAARQWEITSVDFLGDNVTLTLTDRRDGRRYAALDHGHFGVKLHRSTANGWEEIAAPVYPPKPEGYEENDMWGRPINWSTARIWALAAGGADEPGVDLVRNAAGRPVPLDRSRRRAGRCCARSGIIPSASNGWAVAPICPASIRFASIRAIPGACGLRSRPAASGSPRIPARAGRCAAKGMRAEYAPPEQTHDPIAQDVHCLVQCRAAPERMWVQHHNGIFVSSDEGKTFTEITGRGAVDVRLRGRRASARPGYRLVRARDQGREAHPARGQARGHAHPRRRQELRGPEPRGCRSRTPMTWSTDMRWRSTRRASASPSGRPQAGYG